MNLKTNQAFLRRQLFVDGEVQSELLRRVFLYAIGAAVYFLTIVVVEEASVYEDRGVVDVLQSITEQSIYWLPGFIMLTPIMIYDLLKTTNRFAGPVYSLRRELRRLADGESKRPIFFRDGDYWADMATSFNQVREELIERRQTSHEKEPIPVLPPGFEKVVPCEQLFAGGDDEADELEIQDLSE
ncbi:MAG: hypothetical protein AAF958_10085 [Planctomycetota bacterium]